MSRVGSQLKDAREKSNMTLKKASKKLGVSEDFLRDVEFGRKIANESLLNRYKKLLNIKDSKINLLGDAKNIEKAPVKKEAKKEPYKAPETPVNDLWNQAFGDNIKNIPILSEEMKPLGHKAEALTKGKLYGENPERASIVKVSSDNLNKYRIKKGDLLLGFESKVIQGESIMLVEYKNKKMLRHVTNLNNGKIKLSFGDNKEEIIPIKDIKPLIKFIKAEFDI